MQAKKTCIELATNLCTDDNKLETQTYQRLKNV